MHSPAFYASYINPSEVVYIFDEIDVGIWTTIPDAL